MITQRGNIMLPNKIIAFAKELTSLTVSECIAWTFNSRKSSTHCVYNSKHGEMYVSVLHRFDEYDGHDMYLMCIGHRGKNYQFDAESKDTRDYELLKNLYDLAQAANFVWDVPEK